MQSDSLSKINSELIECRLCPRLVQWREQVAREKRRAYRDAEYWGKPVPGFGDPKARLLVVGLAPGAHGSNRTGRPFTGDGSGAFLYPALHRGGFASQPQAISRDDGLELRDIYITAVARCAPPANKPAPAEMDNCQRYIERELNLIAPRVIVCLGQVAFQRTVRLLGIKDPNLKFGHGALYRIAEDHVTSVSSTQLKKAARRLAGSAGTGYWLLCSYHPSQQNTLTGKLTLEMFDAIWRTVRELLGSI